MNYYKQNLIDPLECMGIKVDRRTKLIIDHTLHAIAKEIFFYNEKAYLEILNKYENTNYIGPTP